MNNATFAKAFSRVPDAVHGPATDGGTGQSADLRGRADSGLGGRLSARLDPAQQYGARDPAWPSVALCRQEAAA